jgi:hypothetical protein
MLYGIGVPATVAIGTDILQITVSGAFCAFVYAQDGLVDLPMVATLLLGSTLGARIGAGATNLVDDEIKGFFAAMLLAGSPAVAAKRVGTVYGVSVLYTVSIVLTFGAAILVSGAVVLSAVCRLRTGVGESWCRRLIP